MKALNAILWQVVVILSLSYFGMYYAATFAAGACVSFWVCVVRLAIFLEGLKNEQA